MSARRTAGGWAPWIVTAVALLGIAGVLGAGAALAAENASSDAPPDVTASAPLAPPEPLAEPAVTGAPENTTDYDLTAYPRIDVWSITPTMPVDDDPTGPLTGWLAQPKQGGAAIFAKPTDDKPIGRLPQHQTYGGTIVPVVVRDTHWVKVLLPGRQGMPPRGNPAQTVGWLRAADVAQTRALSYVDVSLRARTIDIVSPAGTERVADDFASGKASTPTPVGRSFIMLTAVVPSFAYAEGHPLVYLGVQSPVYAGFDGGEVAVTAFHYYKQRSGRTSFGCLYLDARAIDRLAELPAGTPVVIRD